MPRAHKKLIIAPALAEHKLLQTPVFEHPAQHVKEPEQGGFAGAIGPNQYRKRRQRQILDAAQAAKAFNADGFDAHGRWRLCLPANIGKLDHSALSTKER
ncbi:hypothetical protein [Rivihabitans pingtungensis]|uniref:hypothetical protein n=1 Tax=Rivihabitans pingtungensis TaxID=1054498 RepID=UPI002CA8FCD6|nr:hypothetical protein [Rivihabitans pingtungensis]HNX72373.1 hypothetical protein [Rivihabitans pingtungensis]